MENQDLLKQIGELKKRIEDLEGERFDQKKYLAKSVKSRHLEEGIELDSPTLKLGSDAQGDIFYTGGDLSVQRLAVGTSGQFLKTQGSSANPIWDTPTTSVLSSKVVTSTRDASAVDGAVGYTGAGFVPTSVTILANIGSNANARSIGMADSAKNMIAQYGADTTTSLNLDSTKIIYIVTAAAAIETAIVTSYDADGVTLTWTKSGSPTGTISLGFIFYK
jgi:hypothetical protein